MVFSFTVSGDTNMSTTKQKQTNGIATTRKKNGIDIGCPLTWPKTNTNILHVPKPATINSTEPDNITRNWKTSTATVELSVIAPWESL